MYINNFKELELADALKNQISPYFQKFMASMKEDSTEARTLSTCHTVRPPFPTNCFIIDTP